MTYRNIIGARVINGMVDEWWMYTIAALKYSKYSAGGDILHPSKHFA
jgi:hypothetical protein